MGCVFGKEVSERQVDRKSEAAAASAVTVRVPREDEGGERTEIRNGANRNENNENAAAAEEGAGRRHKRRSSRPNPRLSNPPKHLHGEQVAAGWPSWLSAVAGEAISGWTPRRADTFEKLDKVKFRTIVFFFGFIINFAELMVLNNVNVDRARYI